ncbi:MULTISPECIES: hypothetical protein [unclassified Microcoleus]
MDDVSTPKKRFLPNWDAPDLIFVEQASCLFLRMVKYVNYN